MQFETIIILVTLLPIFSNVYSANRRQLACKSINSLFDFSSHTITTSIGICSIDITRWTRRLKHLLLL